MILEESKDLIVLGTIKNGAKQFNKISKVTKIPPKELSEVLENLENSGFINVIEKKGWLSKKIEIHITEKEIESLTSEYMSYRQSGIIWKRYTKLVINKNCSKL